MTSEPTTFSCLLSKTPKLWLGGGRHSRFLSDDPKALPESAWIPSTVGRYGRTEFNPEVRQALRLAQDDLRLDIPHAEVDACIKRFLAAQFPRLPGTLLNNADLGHDGRTWSLHRYDAGSFFGPHTDTQTHQRHVATLVLMMPLAYSEYRGGELVVFFSASGFDEFPPDQNRPTLAILPIGTLHEVRPVTSGTRFTLTSKLILPEALFSVMNTPVHHGPLPTTDGAISNSDTVSELKSMLAGIEEEIRGLRAKEVCLAAQLGRALENPLLTRTAERIDSANAAPPFVAMLQNAYTQNDPTCLQGEDVLTYNTLVRRFQDCELRLLNVVVSPIATSSKDWESVITRSPGWPDGLRCSHLDETTTMLLADVPCFYGYETPPGRVVDTRSVYNDEGYDSVDSIRCSVLLVTRDRHF
jgi:predicted 2-oxoglutarate/Fe(II)-dependent dioxygenase YbiX